MGTSNEKKANFIQEILSLPTDTISKIFEQAGNYSATLGFLLKYGTDDFLKTTKEGLWYIFDNLSLNMLSQGEEKSGDGQKSFGQLLIFGTAMAFFNPIGVIFFAFIIFKCPDGDIFKTLGNFGSGLVASVMTDLMRLKQVSQTFTKGNKGPKTSLTDQSLEDQNPENAQLYTEKLSRVNNEEELLPNKKLTTENRDKVQEKALQPKIKT